MAFEHEITFAGIPFFPDEARIVRLDVKGLSSAVVSPPRKFQPLEDLVDELNRRLPFEYGRSVAGRQPTPSQSLAGIANKPRFAPTLRIGDWYYPPTATHWSLFLALA